MKWNINSYKIDLISIGFILVLVFVANKLDVCNAELGLLMMIFLVLMRYFIRDFIIISKEEIK